MHRATALLPLMLLTAACSLGGEPDPSSTLPASTTTAESTTSVPASTTTSIVSDELTTTTCPSEDADFTLLCEVYTLIDRNYVDTVEDATLVDAAIEGLRTFGPTGTQPGPLTCAVPADGFIRVCEELESIDVAGEGIESILFGIAQFGLDSNSHYIDPEALALIEEEQTGSVEGIGALVTTEDLNSDDPANTTCNIVSDMCPLLIVSTMPGSPASSAGVLAGDVFVSVDGVPVDGLSVDEVTAIVRGPVDTEVTILFDRDGAPVEVTIVRAAIEIPVTVVQSFGEVGYLRLNVFTANSGGQVEDDLRSLLEAGASTVVLDLRDNPGGTLEAALDVASEFIEDGFVVRTVGPDEERSYPVREDGIARNPSLELVVLVNRGSASASEVVAGALQERGRAVIVGETTFGKNTVQQRFGLSNGGAMRLTVARWITAEGMDFDDGIVPDVPLELDASLTPEEIVRLVVG